METRTDMETKLTLKKDSKVDGSVYYCVYYGTEFLKLFTTEKEARKFFNECIARIEQGIPKTEIIESYEIKTNVA